MRLATRIAKLEKVIKPPEPGCDHCRLRGMWADHELDRVEVDGVQRWACKSCGNVFSGPLFIIAGIKPGAL